MEQKVIITNKKLLFQVSDQINDLLKGEGALGHYFLKGLGVQPLS